MGRGKENFSIDLSVSQNCFLHTLYKELSEVYKCVYATRESTPSPALVVRWTAGRWSALLVEGFDVFPSSSPLVRIQTECVGQPAYIRSSRTTNWGLGLLRYPSVLTSTAAPSRCLSRNGFAYSPQRTSRNTRTPEAAGSLAMEKSTT